MNRAWSFGITQNVTCDVYTQAGHTPYHGRPGVCSSITEALHNGSSLCSLLFLLSLLLLLYLFLLLLLLPLVMFGSAGLGRSSGY